MRRERLFDYHQRINRERQQRTRDNRQFINTLRTGSRIRELTAKIDAATSSAPSPGRRALRAMSDQRQASRAAVENCTTVSPEVRQSWMSRLDSFESSHSGENPDKIRNLAAEVDGLAEELTRIADNLAGVASNRGFPLSAFRFTPDWSPVLDPLPPLRTARPASFERTPLDMLSRYALYNSPRDLLADDLKPIHDQITGARSISSQLRDHWLDRLGKIDTRSGGSTFHSPAVEKAEKLASDVKAAQSDLVMLAISLRDYARKYQEWWDE